MRFKKRVVVEIEDDQGRHMVVAHDQDLIDELVSRGWTIEFDTGQSPEIEQIMMLIEPVDQAKHRNKKKPKRAKS